MRLPHLLGAALRNTQLFSTLSFATMIETYALALSCGKRTFHELRATDELISRDQYRGAT